MNQEYKPEYKFNISKNAITKDGQALGLEDVVKDIKYLQAHQNISYTLEATKNGIDLRDYFAAKVMQGLLSNPEVENKLAAMKILSDSNIDKKVEILLSSQAYSYADAMMKERDK